MVYSDVQNSRIKPFSAPAEEVSRALSSSGISLEDARIGEWRTDEPTEFLGFLPPVAEVELTFGGVPYVEYSLVSPGRVYRGQDPLPTLRHARGMLLSQEEPAVSQNPPKASLGAITPEELSGINSASFSGYSLNPSDATVLGIVNGDGHVAGAIEWCYSEGYGPNSDRPLVEVAYAVDPKKRERGLATTALARFFSLAYGKEDPRTPEEGEISREFSGKRPVFYADCLHESSTAVAVNAARIAGLSLGAGAHLYQLGVVCLGKAGSPMGMHGEGRYVTSASIFAGEGVSGTAGLENAIGFAEKYSRGPA